MKGLRNSSDNGSSQACPFAAHIFLRSNLILIVNGEQIPRGSKTADTADNTTRWVILLGTGLSAPLQTSRMSLSTFQLSPRIEDDIGSASNVLTAFVDRSSSGK